MRRVAKFCTMLRPVIQFIARIEPTESSTSSPMLSTSVGISGRLGLPRVKCFGRSAFGYDWLIESLRKRCPGHSPRWLHVAPPNAKQNTVADGLKALGGSAQRWFLPSGLSLFFSTFLGGMRMYFPSSLRFA